MNAIEELEQRLRAEFRDLKASLERPKYPNGRYWLDLDVDGHVVTVVWKRDKNFGVSASALEAGYGDGANETFQSVDATFARVVILLRRREHTQSTL